MVSTVRVPFLFAILLFANSAVADLQLTPEEVEYDLEGIKLKHLAFPDSSQRATITYAPPLGWRYSSRAGQLLLQSSRVPEAEGIISVIKLPEPQVFDEPTMKRLGEAVIASAPRAATNVVIVSQQKNPVVIESKETLLVIIQYDSYGTPYARSVMFLNRRNEQVQFQLTSPRKSFTSLQKEFLGSQFSWQNL